MSILVPSLQAGVTSGTCLSDEHIDILCPFLLCFKNHNLPHPDFHVLFNPVLCCGEARSRTLRLSNRDQVPVHQVHHFLLFLVRSLSPPSEELCYPQEHACCFAGSGCVFLGCHSVTGTYPSGAAPCFFRALFSLCIPLHPVEVLDVCVFDTLDGCESDSAICLSRFCMARIALLSSCDMVRFVFNTLDIGRVVGE